MFPKVSSREILFLPNPHKTSLIFPEKLFDSARKKSERAWSIHVKITSKSITRVSTRDQQINVTIF